MSIGPQLPSAGAERQRDVLAHRALHQQRLGAVAGHVGDAGADRVGGMAEAAPPGRRPRWCRRRAGSSRRGRRTARPGPGPRARRRRATSPSRRSKETSSSLVPTRRLRTREARRPRLRRRRRRGAAADGAARCSIRCAEHQLDDPLLGAGRHVDDADGLAVAQHGGAVAERGDLEEAVRDEDDRAAGLGSGGGRRRARARRGWPAAPRSSRRAAARRARWPARARGRGRAARRAGCRARSRGGRGRERRARATQSRNGSTGVPVRRRLAATSRSGISDGSW